MKKFNWFRKKRTVETKQPPPEEEMEHDGSSYRKVSEADDIGRQSYSSSASDYGPSDYADAMPAGYYATRNTSRSTELVHEGLGHSRIKNEPLTAPEPTPTLSTSDNDLANPRVSRDGEEYFMGSQQRGVALIFSHENFDVRKYADEVYQPQTRIGTAVDRDALQHTFRNLDFDVRCFDDLCLFQIRNELAQVAKEDHRKRDCIAVAVLSHGERGGMLEAKDAEYHISELWEPLTARMCRSLAGKPKLFFIQACKGRVCDRGVEVSNTVKDVSDNARAAEVLTYPVPSYADILVSYSTFEGLLSYLNTQNGSWYVNTLCAHLEAHAKTMDLLSLLTEVNRIVGQKFRSQNNVESQLQGLVQAPSFTSSLTRRLCFR